MRAERGDAGAVRHGFPCGVNLGVGAKFCARRQGVLRGSRVSGAGLYSFGSGRPAGQGWLGKIHVFMVKRRAVS